MTERTIPKQEQIIKLPKKEIQTIAILYPIVFIANQIVHMDRWTDRRTFAFLEKHSRLKYPTEWVFPNLEEFEGEKAFFTTAKINP